MNIQTRKLSELRHADYNPRKKLTPLDPEYQKIARSIDEFGYVDPIIINSDNTIIGGHQRATVLKDKGWDEVKVVVLDIPKEQEKALNVALNKISGEWDMGMLKDLLLDIDSGNYDVTLTGFDLDEIEGLMLQFHQDDPVEEDDFDSVAAYEEIEEPETQPGDIWYLGEHRVMCGDSCNASDVAKLMDGEKADLVFTDPPYGMKKEADGVVNDNLNYDDLLEFNKRWIPITFSALKDVGSWYCWGIDEPLMDIYSNILKPMAKENKITFRNLITWNKGNGMGQNSESFRMYPTADEKCLFVMCGVQGFNCNADNYNEGWEPIRSYLDSEMNKCGGTKNWKAALGNHMGGHYFTKSQWCMPTEEAYNKLRKFGAEYSAFKREYSAFKREYSELKREYSELKREWYETRAYFDNTHDNMNNVWHFDRTSSEERESTGGHATPKPIPLCIRAVKTSSRPNEIVLDVFGGSGSTLIACEQVTRKARLMELEPMWCDVIVKRYVKLTGDTSCYCITGKGHRVEYADAFGE